MRPAGSTAVCSTMTSPAPDSDSEPRCCRCQSFAAPFSALYWHIGDTAMRLTRVRPPIVNGENRCEVIRNSTAVGNAPVRVAAQSRLMPFPAGSRHEGPATSLLMPPLALRDLPPAAIGPPKSRGYRRVRPGHGTKRQAGAADRGGTRRLFRSTVTAMPEDYGSCILLAWKAMIATLPEPRDNAGH